MEWSKGYGVSYYAARVDPRTWRDIERIEITGGSVKREPSGLRESADIDCRYDVDIEMWVRIYMDVEQTGDNAHVALFTGLASSPASNINGVIRDGKLECYSVLKPADDVILQRGYYAQAGRRGTDIIKELLSVIPAPVVVAENAPTLSSNIIAEDGESNLTMVERILEAINWRVRITGDGTVQIVPQATEPSVSFDPISNDCIEQEIKVEADWYSCPNVYMAIADDVTGIARDDSVDSPLSTVNRGREVWTVETGCELADDESIGQYASRKLVEAQRIQKTAEYDRRYYPDVVPSDLIRLHYPEQGLEGLFMVESQSIELGYGARTSEEVSTYLTADALKEKTHDVGLVNLVTDDGTQFADSDGNTLIAFEA